MLISGSTTKLETWVGRPGGVWPAWWRRYIGTPPLASEVRKLPIAVFSAVTMLAVMMPFSAMSPSPTNQGMKSRPRPRRPPRDVLLCTSTATFGGGVVATPVPNVAFGPSNTLSSPVSVPVDTRMREKVTFDDILDRIPVIEPMTVCTASYTSDGDFVPERTPNVMAAGRGSVANERLTVTSEQLIGVLIPRLCALCVGKDRGWLRQLVILRHQLVIEREALSVEECTYVL